MYNFIETLILEGLRATVDGQTGDVAERRGRQRSGEVAYLAQQSPSLHARLEKVRRFGREVNEIAAVCETAGSWTIDSD